MRTFYRAAFFATAFLLLAGPALTESHLDQLKLPPGFEIKTVARAPGAREIALGLKGGVFISSLDEGKVYLVRPKSSEAEVVASGLHHPNGIAFEDGALYIAEINRISRILNAEEEPARRSELLPIVTDLPSNRSHGWKYLRFGPDRMLYYSQGMPCNVCLPPDQRFGTINRMNRDGSNRSIFAVGIRNSVGFDWSPLDRTLWFTDNGRDYLGDDSPPDELNRAAEPGLHFGFPYCHGKNISDPEFGRSRRCSEFQPAAGELTPHGAALGMSFYRGSRFPLAYRKMLFVAEHGSWNRSIPIGYRVMMAEIAGSEVTSYQPFIEGWLKDGKAWGRPVDVKFTEDGSMLISDDKTGWIYWVGYVGEGG